MSLIQRYQANLQLGRTDSKHLQDFPNLDEDIEVTSLATAAFLQDKLSPRYCCDSGQIKRISSPTDIHRLVKAGFHVTQVGDTFYLTRGLRGGANFSSTLELAKKLKETPKSDPGYSDMETLAVGVITEFSKHSKTKAIIDEVAELALAENTIVTKALLSALVHEINNGGLLNVDFLLKALKTTLINSFIDDVSPNDLIQVLTITLKRIGEIHTQAESMDIIHIAVSTLSDILDVMVDANVNRVDRIKLHAPLYENLEDLSKSNDILTKVQAAYAKQALVRLPDNESKLSGFLRRGKAAAQGCASLYKVVDSLDLSSLPSIYEHFIEAIESQEEKKSWYNDIRVLKLLLAKRCYKEFNKIIDIRIQRNTDPLITGNILFMLHDVVHNNLDLKARKWALDQMSDLFINNDRWDFASNKEIKDFALRQIKDANAVPNQAISEYAKQVLQKILDLINTKSGIPELQRRMIERVSVMNIDNIKPKAVHHGEEPSTTLITAAQRFNVLSLTQKLQKLKEKILNPEDPQQVYIPVFGSRDPVDARENTFALENAIQDFLQSDRPVFLLLGDSGGGKTTFLRHIENLLWKDWTPQKPIPLYIALKPPIEKTIANALKANEFTDAEIKELRDNHAFIFLLDGYDELKEKKNLYVENQLHLWKSSKTIITCRSQYLNGEQSSYHEYFTPPPTNLITKTPLEQASVSPFTFDQIEAYCRKFIEIYKIPRMWEQYKTDIDFIPDLAETIQNPFLLSIIVRVLPSIIEKHRHSNSQDKLKLLRIDIFDAFIDDWFTREKYRIMHMGKIEEIPGDFKKTCIDFASKLAFEMIQEGVISIDYEPNSSLFDQKTNKWDKYFGTDPKKDLVRSAIPLRRIGPHSHAFIHKSLLEYFSSRAIIPLQTLPQSVISFDKLNSKLLTNDPEIIFLLAECVTKNSSLKNLLFTFIEDSKTNPQAATAAANAITILNAARISLSRKDFHGIRISGADLSGANLTSTDLSGSDLSNVELTDADLRFATIAKCKTDGLEFGQRPFIRSDSLEGFFTLSSNGKWALIQEPLRISNNDQKLGLWDCETGKQLQRFKLNDQVANHTLIQRAISADGKMLFLGGKDHSVLLLECKTGKELKRFQKHTQEICCIAISNDGKRVLSGSKDHTVRLWDCDTGEEIQCFQSANEISLIALSQDGSRALSVNLHDEVTHLWDCKTGKELHGFKGLSEVLSATISSDGKWALTGYMNGMICLWDCETGKELRSFQGHMSWVTSLAFSNNGKWAISGGMDQTVRLWDCNSGKELRCFQGHGRFVHSLAFSIDDKYAFSGADTIRIWNLASTKKQKIKDGYLHLYGKRLSCDCKLAWDTDTKHHSITVWDCETGKQLQCFQGHSENVNSVAFTSNCKRALSGSEDGTLRLWDCDNSKEFHCFQIGKPVTNVIFSHDDNRALIQSEDEILRLWDSKSPKELLCFQRHNSKIFSLSSDGKRALLETYHSVYLWDCDTGKELRCFENLAQCNIFGSVDMTFSTDGKWILLAASDQSVKLIACETGDVIKSFIPPHDTTFIDSSLFSMYRVAFFDKGKKILSGNCCSKIVHLWDCADNSKPLHSITMPNYVVGINPTSDGRKVLISLWNGSHEMWELYDEKGLFRPSLLWSIGTTTLSANDLNIEGVDGLSELNHSLLLQHGAIV